jgi:hypothetical protein
VGDVSNYKPRKFAIKGATAIRATARALLCHWGEGRDREFDHWIAVSQIDAASQVKRAGDSGELIISEWFAVTAKLLPASETRADD